MPKHRMCRSHLRSVRKPRGSRCWKSTQDEPRWVLVNNNDTLMKLNFTDNGVNVASANPLAPVDLRCLPASLLPGSPPAESWPPEYP